MFGKRPAPGVSPQLDPEFDMEKETLLLVVQLLQTENQELRNLCQTHHCLPPHLDYKKGEMDSSLVLQGLGMDQATISYLQDQARLEAASKLGTASGLTSFSNPEPSTSGITKGKGIGKKSVKKVAPPRPALPPVPPRDKKDFGLKEV